MRKFIFLPVFFSLFSLSLFGQNILLPKTVSPYSRYGIGDFQLSGGQINNGMGGGGIGIRNDSLYPQYINLQNPASLTAHQVVAYEVSLTSNTVQLHSSTASGSFNRTTLGNLALAFPVTKWWGAGFGLTPYTAVGYNVSTDDVVDGIGDVTYKYQGSGGVNQAFFINAIRPFAGATRRFLLSSKYDNLKLTNDTVTMKKKIRNRDNLGNISIGVNTSYLFGSLTYVRRDVFPDASNIFNTKITKRTLFRDFYLNYGIQYSFRINRTHNPLYTGLNDSNVTARHFFKNYFNYTLNGHADTAKLYIHAPGVRVSIGAVFAPPTRISTSDDLLAQTYTLLGTFEQIRDTVQNDNGIRSSVVLPAMGGFGFALKKDYRWMFQADYMMQLWSNFTVGGQNEGLKNSQRITAGFQFQPGVQGRSSFLKSTQYRIGGRWYQTYLDIAGTQLVETSVNFSMSLPVPYNVKLGEPISRATLSLDYGVRGTTNNGLIRENFFRVTVGFTINDRWFSRYKFD